MPSLEDEAERAKGEQPEEAPIAIPPGRVGQVHEQAQDRLVGGVREEREVEQHLGSAPVEERGDGPFFFGDGRLQIFVGRRERRQRRERVSELREGALAVFERLLPGGAGRRADHAQVVEVRFLDDRGRVGQGLFDQLVRERVVAAHVRAFGRFPLGGSIASSGSVSHASGAPAGPRAPGEPGATGAPEARASSPARM